MRCRSISSFVHNRLFKILYSIYYSILKKKTLYQTFKLTLENIASNNDYLKLNCKNSRYTLDETFDFPFMYIQLCHVRTIVTFLSSNDYVCMFTSNIVDYLQFISVSLSCSFIYSAHYGGLYGHAVNLTNIQLAFMVRNQLKKIPILRQCDPKW